MMPLFSSSFPSPIPVFSSSVLVLFTVSDPPLRFLENPENLLLHIRLHPLGPMSSSNVNHLSHPSIYGRIIASYEERKSRFMKWLSKLFKSGGSSQGESTGGQQPQFPGVESMGEIHTTKSCFNELTHPKCDVCRQFIPRNRVGSIEYGCHPFWSQKYCPSHEHDNMARCCSCERLEGFHDMPETTGLCLSEQLTVPAIRKRLTEHCRVAGIRKSQKATWMREVTAILVLYGLPRLLTGAILAHELMHAWLYLKGYPKLKLEVEEGICQVLSFMWLESEVMRGSRNTTSTSATSSSSTLSYGSTSTASSSSSLSSSKKGGKSGVDNKLGEFFMHQIAYDASPDYGEGFRAAMAAVNNYGLCRTLDHIRLMGTFPE